MDIEQILVSLKAERSVNRKAAVEGAIQYWLNHARIDSRTSAFVWAEDLRGDLTADLGGATYDFDAELIREAIHLLVGLGWTATPVWNTWKIWFFQRRYLAGIRLEKHHEGVPGRGSEEWLNCL